MIIALTDTQKELQQVVRKFTREEIAPKAPQYDASMEFPWEIVKKLWELGILNPMIPEAYGAYYILDIALILKN